MIIVTKMAVPEVGWLMALHCRRCRRTVFGVNPYAAKPENGDYWVIEGCVDDTTHNLDCFTGEAAEKLLPSLY